MPTLLPSIDNLLILLYINSFSALGLVFIGKIANKSRVRKLL